MIRVLLWAWLVALSCGFAGCSVVSVRDEPPLRDPAELSAWSLQASVLARGNTRGRASLRWEQQGERFSLTVSGLFGLGATRIEGDANEARVRRGDKEYLSQNPDADLAAMLGVPITVETLARWVRGVTADVPPVGAWQVAVEERQVVGLYSLPEALTIQGPEQELVLSRMRWDIRE